MLPADDWLCLRLSWSIDFHFFWQEKQEVFWQKVRLLILRCALLSLRVDFDPGILYQLVLYNPAKQHEIAMLQLCASEYGLDNFRNISLFDMGWHADSCC